jgi:Flagellar biogenesis protein
MMTWSTYAQFALALVFVLGLIGGFALLARRLGYGHARRGPSGRRLALVEVMPLDARRRLVLVRRDQVEHLLLISATGEHVVETGIGTAHTFASHLSADVVRNEGGVA